MEFSRMNISKSCLAVAIATAMLSGCGSGGSKHRGGGDAQPQQATVAGAAMKGIIKNGVVKVYGVGTDGQRQATPLATGRTSSTDGTYSLQVTGYTGPVVVEVTALGSSESGYPSLMVCDIPGTNSCVDDADDSKDIGFGEDYPLGDTFKLKAVVPSVSSGAVTANVSALTHLAAEVLEQPGAKITQDSVQAMNSQVASLFNLTSTDLTTLPVVDITKPVTSSTAADKDAAKVATISAGLLAAAKTEGETIESAVAAVATQFAGNGGQLVNNETGNTSTITLSEILAKSSDVVDAATEANSSSSSALGQVQTDINTEKGTADAAQPGSTTTAQPSEELLNDSFKKAKLLVSDLRDLAAAATFDDIREGTTEFADNLKVARELIRDDTGYLVDALAQVAKAIGDAHKNAADDAESYAADNGITVTISGTGDNRTYSYDGDVVVQDDGGTDHTVDVTLAGVGSFATIETGEDLACDVSAPYVECGEGETTTNANFAVHGSAFNTVVSLTIGEGSHITIENLKDAWADTNTTAGQTETNSTTATDIDFELKGVKLEQAGTDGASFAGAMALKVTGLRDDSSSTQKPYECVENDDGETQTQTCSGSWGESYETTFTAMSVSLAGKFVKGAESFDASFTVSATNSGGYVQENSYESTYVWNGIWQDFGGGYGDYVYNGDFHSEHETSNDETADKFIKLNFTLDLKANIAGISDEVGVRLTGDRSALRKGTASLVLRYKGKTITAELNTTNATGNQAAVLTISSNQGALLTFADDNVDDENEVSQGIISVDGVQEATVKEENGVAVVRYNNGYFESIQ